MSSLSQFAPFAGGGLKSFQTGFVNSDRSGTGALSSEDCSFLDVTISSVNTAKAIPGGYVGGGNYLTGSGVYNFNYFYFDSQCSAVGFRLTSATNLRMNNGDAQRFYGRWQVAEAN
jgi:hypothetical protein